MTLHPATCPLPDCTEPIKRDRRTDVIDHLEKVHSVEFERKHGGNEAVKRAAYSRRFRAWLIQNNYPPELDAFFNDVKDGISGRDTGFVADDNAVEVQGPRPDGAMRNRGESSGTLASSPHLGKATEKPRKSQVPNENMNTTATIPTTTRAAHSEDETNRSTQQRHNQSQSIGHGAFIIPSTPLINHARLTQPPRIFPVSVDAAAPLRIPMVHLTGPLR